MADHICAINENLCNFTQLSLHSNVLSINVHSNSIRDFAGLQSLSRLKSLDASSNEICDLNTLPQLSSLRVLNLASNHISDVHVVAKLQNVLSLNLSYNQLSNLQGFAELHGSECRLETLELHGNQISQVNDVIFNLQGVRSLQHLVLRHDKDHDNPVCNVPDYRKNVLNGLPQLKTLDRRNRNNEIAVPGPDSVLEVLGLDFSLDDIESSDQLSSVSKSKSPHTVTRSMIQTPNIDAVISKVKTRPCAQIQSAEDNSIVDSIISSMDCNKPTTEEEITENLISNKQEARLKLLEEQLANLVAVRKEKGMESSPKVSVNNSTTASSVQCSKIPKQSLTKRSKIKRRSSLEKKQTTLHASAGSYKHVSVQQGPSEKDTYLNLVKELESERERRWKSEQAVRRLAQLVRDMSSEKAEGQSLRDMAAQTAERLKQALLGEREETERLKSDLLDAKEKIKELEEQLIKYHRTIEGQQSSFRAMEATATKASSDRSKILASQTKKVHECEMRLSAAAKEAELTKCQNAQLQCRVNELQGLLVKIEQEHRKATENLFSPDSMEFHNAVSRELNKEGKRHREGKKALEQTIANLRHEYGELEDEFRQALHIEADRYEKTKAQYQQCAGELEKIKSSFRVTKDREEKSRSVVTELTVVAKEQKIKINELSKNKNELVQQYKERIFNLEISAEEGRKKGVQLELIKQEKSRLVSQLAAVQSVVDGLRDERKLWGHELAQQGASLAQDRGRLESRIETLQNEVHALQKQNERDLDALKIKSKVVDDQTETIHKMKQALSDKDQEIKRIQEESLSLQRKMEQDIEDLTHDNAALNEQIQVLLERKKELKSQILEHEKDLENLKHSHSKLVKKWSEKGQVLSQVEGQVRQMKEAFDEKEKKLLKDRDEAIQIKQMLMERMERVDVAFREQLEAANSAHAEEKKLMDRNYQNEIKSMKRKVNSVEEEMREVLRDAERQKMSMEVKLQKVTSAFKDFQDGF